MKILSIETSCDETAISLIEFNDSATGTQCIILGDALASQANLHAQYGGVFPMMAKREHQKNIVPLLLEVLGISTSPLPSPDKERENSFKQILFREPELLEIFLEKVIQIPKPDIDAIAVTVGPGLEPALWVGINFAKALSYLWNIPVIPVNHMEGHIFSIFPTTEKEFTIPNSKDIFPIVSLLVSGGHTELILVKDWGDYTLLGATVDDAAGEAFDKVARMLDLPYPGGPEISRLASTERASLEDEPETNLARSGEKARGPDKLVSGSDDLHTLKLPRPMIHSKDYNFSFSGLKTAVLYTIRDLEIKPPTDKTKQAIAKEFEDSVVDVLVHKTLRAIEEYNAKTIIVGGGVSANTHLQKVLREKVKKEYPDVAIHFPTKALTTDNAIMIALAGYFQSKIISPTYDYMSLKAQGNMAL